MNLYIIRNMLRKSSIYDLPLRVTFYARVSSNLDIQLNSLDNQVSYYTELIKGNPNWTFVPGYVDEGISGASAKKRDDFQRMVSDAKQGKFDLVITKEITRFARNTLDSIMYTRELLSAGVGVLFENDGINTFDDDSELRLTIMSGIAQDELRKLSSRVKFGHQQAIKKGVVLGNGRMFGYRKENGRLIIDEYEAKMILLVFDLYSTNHYSLKQLEDIIWEKGYRNHNGKKIAHTTLSNVISNPKYKGYYVGNKVKIVDPFTKKQKFLPKEEWVMYKDETGEVVPAIVSEEVWDRANAVLQTRGLDVKTRQNKYTHQNLLTGKLFCTHCGLPYYRRDAMGKPGVVHSTWRCSGKIKNRKKSCPSFNLYEADLIAILIQILSGNASSHLLSMESFQDVERSAKEIAFAEKKLEKLRSLFSDKKIDKNDFDQFSSTIDANLRNLKRALKEKKTNEEMHAAFFKAGYHNTVTLRFLCEEFIDCIAATVMEDLNTVMLDFQTVTGDIFRFYVKRRKKSR